jgi:hypothetical protein
MLIEHNVHHNSHSFYSDLSIHSTTDTDQTQPQADLRVRSLPAAPLVHGQVQQTWGPHQLLIWKMNHLAALYLQELMD